MSLTAETSGRLGGRLRSSEADAIERWTLISVARLRGRMTRNELAVQVREVFAALVALLTDGGAAVGADGTADGAARVGLDAPAAADLRAVLTELSRTWARAGFSPRETASFVFAAKEALEDLAETGSVERVDLFELFRLIDEMGLFTFETYSRAREELLVDQGEQLLELSTPVVKLWDGIVAVPLVGTLDSARAQVVMEKLLQALVDTGSGYAIVDITGVPAVDTQVAQHILKTVVAARLMGAECVISGIRPQIAQTVVALGIEFGDIVTKATLADALVYALRASGIDVVRRSTRDL